MPAGRSNRVLFDLIPQRDAEPARSTSGKPVVRVELKPQDAPRAAPTPTPAPAPTPTPAPTQSPAPTAAPRYQAPSYARPLPAAHPEPVSTPRSNPTSTHDLPRAAGTPYPKVATFRWPAFLGTTSVGVPVNLLYLAIAALVAVCVIVFLVGFGAGKSKAETTLAGSARLDEPPVVEPSGTSPRLLPPTPTPTPTPTNPATTPGSASNAGRQNPRATPTPTPSSTPAPFGAILTARGAVMTDPRVAELNYLSLASLGEEDAKAAIAFLSANGIDAIGVPRVDPDAGRANNQGPTQVFRIYALPGITRDEYSQKLTARTNLEAAVAKIGATWQKEHRGASNFARTMWEKFKP